MAKNKTAAPFEACDRREPFIFVSYAHKNDATVFRDIDFLHKAGYRIWA